MNNLFADTQKAFALKSDSELDRALFLFELIKRESLVKIGAAFTQFFLNAHLPVERLIRATVFDHFCGGISKKDCLNIIEKMHSKNVYSVLDYSSEGKNTEEQFDLTLLKIISNIEFAKFNEAVPFVVFKPSGFGNVDLYRKVSSGVTLSSLEELHWKRIFDRFDTVCGKVKKNNIPLLIDAEESWIQKAADELVENMMALYNKEQAIVFCTLQMYRTDRLDYLKSLYQKAIEEGFTIGAKLVRGAYLEKERLRAAEMAYTDPICKNKKTTDNQFNNALEYILNHSEHISLFAGTHNEKSCLQMISLMEKKKLNNRHPKVWFGQLYGMSDHISYNLSHLNYNVAKYLPYGPVRDVMPYLIRRAEENTSVAGQTSRELELIKKEISRRKAP